jgi:superfamily II DNA/RNA helicase
MGKAPASIRMKVKFGLPPSKQEMQNLNAFLSAARQASTAVEPFVHSDAKPTPKLLTAVGKLVEAHKKNPRQKSIVYSNYLEGGLGPYAQLLDKAKIPYGVYTGEQPRRYRDELVEKYNRGEIPVLLLSSAGGEGLDLKGTRLVQVLEPHWNDEKIEQAIGRAIRYKSHSELPHDERNVTVQKFMSLPRQGFFGRLFGMARDKGTDEYLTALATGKTTLNDQVLNLMKQKDGPRVEAEHRHRVREQVKQKNFIDFRKSVGISHSELRKMDRDLAGVTL